MIHGDVCGALLEIPHGIAPRLHQFFDQAVAVRDGGFRVIHETGLRRGPLLSKPRLLFQRKRTEVEFLDPLPARYELVLGLAPVAAGGVSLK